MPTTRLLVTRRIVVASVVALFAAAPWREAGAQHGIGVGTTLTGARARNSPQADAFLAYERAFIKGGLEAAERWMAPSKQGQMLEFMMARGEEGLEKLRTDMRKARVSPAQARKRIRTVVVTGDHAYLETETGRPETIKVVDFEKVAGRWKVAAPRR